jgi:predicted ArsR family transcriptional regulator
MSKRYPKYEFSLNSRGIKDLSTEEIRAILRAADELIAAGGRSLLSKILKGSKDKKVLIIAT